MWMSECKMNKGANVHNNSFIDKWSRIRDKGRFKYLVTRGFVIGLLIFLIWFAVTITTEIILSEFRDIILSEKRTIIYARYAMWFIYCEILGFTFANLRWKRNEQKFQNLSK